MSGPFEFLIKSKGAGDEQRHYGNCCRDETTRGNILIERSQLNGNLSRLLSTYLSDLLELILVAPTVAVLTALPGCCRRRRLRF